jgi:hypothetical protein
MSAAAIADDPATCSMCGARAQQRTCDGCGLTTRILDCGDMPQPRPIAAGRADASDLGRTYCATCAQGGRADA